MSASAERTPTALLAARVRQQPGRPLLTQYDEKYRTELSAATFANWVDKTTNWLEDEGIADLLEPAGPAPVVAAELLAEHPTHWMSFAWVLAAWQAGLAISPRPVEGAVLRVGGPAVAGDGTPTLACSLHPLALPGQPAAGVLDWSAEVRAQPDAHVTAPSDPVRTAWLDGAGCWTTGELLAEVTPAAGSVLLTEERDPRRAISVGLLGPLLAGGSAVLAPGVSAQRLRQIRADERTDRPGPD